MTDQDPDTILDENERRLIAMQVANEAKADLKSWALWIIAPVVLILGLFGVKELSDVASKLNEVDARVATTLEAVDDTVAKELSKASGEIQGKLKQVDETIDQRLSKAINQALRDEADQIGRLKVALTQSYADTLTDMKTSASQAKTSSTLR